MKGLVLILGHCFSHNSLNCFYILIRYHEIFFMVDTCQAQSMHQEFYSPNILSVGSSKVGEDSLSVSPLCSINVTIVVISSQLQFNLFHCRLFPSTKFASTHFCTCVKKSSMKVKYLDQEHNALSRGPNLDCLIRSPMH